MIILEGFIAKFTGALPRTVGQLLPKVVAMLENTSKENIDRHVLFRKTAGLLREMDPDEEIVQWENFSPTIFNGNHVVFPLNMDETYTTCKRLVNAGKMVFPITHPLFNNKHARNLLFPGFAPFSIHVPEAAFHDLTTFDFQACLETHGIERVMIKDDYGYHSGNVIPYIITPTKNVNDRVKEFVKKANRLVDVGGIVIDEFIGDTTQDVYKVHVFDGVIPGEALHYRVKLDGLDGVFKSCNLGEPQLLSGVSVTVPEGDAPGIQTIHQLVKETMPFAFTSIDYIMRDDKPVIIDVNSKAGSLGEVQERGGPGNPFSFFANRVREMITDPNTMSAMRDHIAKIDEAVSFLSKRGETIEIVQGRAG